MPTREENLRFWGRDYDWSDRGESWTPGEVWRRTILENALWPHQRPGMDVLEIGPGAGRWTEHLLRGNPRSLTLVDLAPKCLDMCRERFGAEWPHIRYLLGDGMSLVGVADESVDLVWSFDVFVHIEKPQVRGYMHEFARVLRPGALAILHYASIDRARCEDPRSGWRADFTSGDLRELLAEARLELLADHYDPELSHTNSSIAVFRRPQAG